MTTGIPSVRRHLLWWLLPGTLAIFLVSLLVAWWISLDTAEEAHDQGLIDAAREVAGQLRAVPPSGIKELPPRAQRSLLANAADRVYFRVESAQGGLLAGDRNLPLPNEAPSDEEPVVYDTKIAGQTLRAVALRYQATDQEVLVIIGSTVKKRDKIISEIILGLLVPELLLIGATLAVIWFGVRAGLTPLASLRDELAHRSATDLSPLRSQAPEEIQPVVEEINSLLLRLDKSLTSQRNFVSDAAHQLRTPIAALQAQVEATLRESDRETRVRLEKVLSPALRLSHLVDQMLALARAEPTSRQAVRLLDLALLVRTAADNWLPLAIEKGIDLGFDLRSAPVRGNEVMLSELLANLINNALHHTPAGGSVTVSCGTGGSQAWINVEDSGPGIAEGERTKIFGRFYQTPDNPGNGCGLGLAIVAEIALQHGGQAFADHSPSLGGARVGVSLPAVCDGPG